MSNTINNIIQKNIIGYLTSAVQDSKIESILPALNKEALSANMPSSEKLAKNIEQIEEKTPKQSIASRIASGFRDMFKEGKVKGAIKLGATALGGALVATGMAVTVVGSVVDNPAMQAILKKVFGGGAEVIAILAKLLFAPISEVLIQLGGSAINYGIDRTDIVEKALKKNKMLADLLGGNKDLIKHVVQYFSADLEQEIKKVADFADVKFAKAEPAKSTEAVNATPVAAAA